MERSDDLGRTFVPEDGATPDSVKGRISSGEKRWLPIRLDDTVKLLMKPVAQWHTSDGAEVVAGIVSASCIPDDLDDQNIVLARYRPERRTWSLLSLPNLPSIFPESTNPVCRHFQAIATMWVDPDDPNTIVAIRYQLVGVSGNLFDYSQGNLLWSRDGGETWTEDQTRISLSTTPNLSLLTPLWNGERWTVLILRHQLVWLDQWTMKNELRIIQVDPRHPTTPIRAIQMPDMVRNNEGTPVWYVGTGVPITRYLVMATVPDAPQTVLIVHPATAQVYRSVDNGQTWTGPVAWGAPASQRFATEYVLTLGYDPFRRRMVLSVRNHPEHLYAAATSSDGGQTWEADWSPSGGYTAFYRDPARPHIGYATKPYLPLIRTTDGGRTWTVVTDAQPRHVSPKIGNTVGIRHMSLGGAFPIILDLTDPTRPVWKIPGRTPDHYHPQILGIVRQPDGHFRWYGQTLSNRDDAWSEWFASDDDGQTWSRISKPDGVWGLIYSPMLTHPRTPNVLFLKTDTHILRSTDYGATWTPLSLTFADGSVSSSDEIRDATLVLDPIDPTRWYLIRSSDRGSDDFLYRILCGEPTDTGYTIRACITFPKLPEDESEDESENEPVKFSFGTVRVTATGEPGKTRLYVIRTREKRFWDRRCGDARGHKRYADNGASRLSSRPRVCNPHLS